MTMRNSYLYALVGLLASLGVSSMASSWAEERLIQDLKEFDQLLMKSYGMKPADLVTTTHAILAQFTEADALKQDVVWALKKNWQVNESDCDVDTYLIWLVRYYRIVQSHPECVSEALRNYVIFVYQRVVDKCTRKFSANKWKAFLKAAPFYRTKEFASFRKKLLKLMDFAIDGTEPDDVMLNKMADRVRQFNRKNRNAVSAFDFLDAGSYYEKVFMHINYQIPADAPKDVKKIYLLWLVWSKIPADYWTDLVAFFRGRRSMEEQGLLRFAAGAANAEAGINQCSKATHQSPAEVKRILTKACGALDKRAATIANLVDALELANDKSESYYMASRAAIFCWKFNGAQVA